MAVSGSYLRFYIILQHTLKTLNSHISVHCTGWAIFVWECLACSLRTRTFQTQLGSWVHYVRLHVSLYEDMMDQHNMWGHYVTNFGVTVLKSWSSSREQNVPLFFAENCARTLLEKERIKESKHTYITMKAIRSTWCVYAQMQNHTEKKHTKQCSKAFIGWSKWTRSYLAGCRSCCSC